MPKRRAVDTTLSYLCSSCGCPVDLSDYQHSVKFLPSMYHKQQCYNCAFWEYTAEHRPENSVVLEGELVSLRHEPKNRFAVKLRKHVHVITADHRLVHANAVVFHGKIPERFRQYFPDNAVAISRELYDFLSSRQTFHCRRKGCLDRYHCYFYDAEKMEVDGAWNQVPEGYEAGWENCAMFIDKVKLFAKIMPPTK